MITKEQEHKIDNLFKQIATLESSETSTMTEISVCKDLVSQKFDTNLSYLDICCGKGTILLCLYLEFWKNLMIEDVDSKNEYILKRICGNDISENQVGVTKRALKKVQKIFKVNNIIEPNVYNINILKNENLLMNELKKKFSCVITNPAYNSERGNNNQSVDIYPKFVEKAYELADRYVIMITKSNWMNFPKHKKFREK